MPRAWILLLILALVGCAPEAKHVGGQPAPVPTVVSLSPSTTEVVAQYGYTGQLRGRTESCNFPVYIVNDKNVQVFGGVKPNYEKLAEAKPGLVVYDAFLYSPADMAKIKEVATDTFPLGAHTVTEFEDQLRGLGAKLVAPLQISGYVDKIEAERRSAAAAAPSSHPKIAAISGTLVAGNQSFVADVIRVSGGEPAGPDGDRFMTLNPEALIKSDPDAILLAADVSKYLTDNAKQAEIGKKAVDAFEADPRYKALRAVRSGHVYPLNADVLDREGSRVDLLIKSISTVVQAVAK